MGQRVDRESAVIKDHGADEETPNQHNARGPHPTETSQLPIEREAANRTDRVNAVRDTYSDSQSTSSQSPDCHRTETNRSVNATLCV
jgi:hypothetical protein